MGTVIEAEFTRDGEFLHWAARMMRRDPDCRSFIHWLIGDFLRAIDPFGFRGPPGQGNYVATPDQVRLIGTVEAKYAVARAKAAKRGAKWATCPPHVATGTTVLSDLFGDFGDVRRIPPAA